MAQTTYMAKPSTLTSRWYLVDARGQTLGRLAVNVARVLRGKHRPEFTPHLNTGEHVIVINAQDLVVTGNKRSAKQYDRYSGYPSGRHVRTFDQAKERDATYPLRHAIKGMLQHNTLGADQLKRLRIYAGSEHHHEAQKPQLITFGELGEIIVASNEQYFYGTGRRKTSVARVRLQPGDGVLIINGRSSSEFFGRRDLETVVTQPLRITEMSGRFTASVKVTGGGIAGQAGAICHGIARALIDADAELRPALKKAGLLTRDPREKERKKYGLKRARKAPQYTKR